GTPDRLSAPEPAATPQCQSPPVPNNLTSADGTTGPDALSAIEKFAFCMRFLAPPPPSPDTPGGAASIGRGRLLFGAVGCTLCHTPVLRTGPSTVEALSDKPARLFSDLLVHGMGPGLADDIVQGQAGGDEFRTAPLWGLGKRILFLHDGRTTELLEAIWAQRGLGARRFRSPEAIGV